MSSRLPRILFYDYWTKGLDKFRKVIEGAGLGAADYQLLHLGSYRDASTPETEVIRGLPCMDISMFRRMRLDQIIKALHPDVVVGLNIATLFDRAILLTCGRLSIPTVFLQHGSWADRDNLEAFLKSLDEGFTMADRLRRVPAFVCVLPWYLRARGGSVVELTPWRVIWRLARNPTMSHFFPTAPEELWPTLALVFTQDNADTLVETHRMPRERLRVVGNPELDPVVARRVAPVEPASRGGLVRSLGLDPAVPIVCYLEDGFVEQQNCFGWTEARRVELLRELYSICRGVEVQLLVRPHPGTDLTAMHDALAGRPGVVVTRDLTLLDSLDVAQAALGTVSTALETAVVLGKPLLVPLWYFGGQASLSPYVRYGAATAVQSPHELPRAIMRAVRGELSPAGTEEFIQRRLDPADGRAMPRIVSAIFDLAQAHLCS